MNLTDKKVAVLGCGRSGIAAAELAMQMGAQDLCLFDSSASASCQNKSITLCAGAGEAEALAYAADLVIISPGIDGETAWVQAFCQANNAPLIGETELAYHAFKGTIIGITGTNGKTTTTALIEHLLRQAGKHATACGNYGCPLSSVVLSDEACDYAVLEISSFQMETIVDFKPDIALWLNFAADHMDRYKSVEDYYRAKKNTFMNMTGEQRAIVRVGENLGQLPCPSESFSAFESSGTLHYQDMWIKEGEQALIDLSKSRLTQAHNAENAMAALLCCRALGLSLDSIQRGINSFEPPAHRCEFVSEFDNILWLNDSKSTNIHSTFAALRSQTRPVVLILGGKDKGLDYDCLCPTLQEKVQLCICFGEIKEQLLTSLSPSCRCLGCNTVQECVSIAKEHARGGDVVLFSPATSSFDQFTGYTQRGECFRQAVLDQIKP